MCCETEEVENHCPRITGIHIKLIGFCQKQNFPVELLFLMTGSYGQSMGRWGLGGQALATDFPRNYFSSSTMRKFTRMISKDHSRSQSLWPVSNKLRVSGVLTGACAELESDVGFHLGGPYLNRIVFYRLLRGADLFLFCHFPVSALWL